MLREHYKNQKVHFKQKKFYNIELDLWLWAMEVQTPRAVIGPLGRPT